MIEQSRKDTIELLIDNYYEQVKIVRHTTLTLMKYLKNIGLNEIELKYIFGYVDNIN